MSHHEPPIITADTRIWLFKTNPKYYAHIMKPVEGGSIQQYIQNNSHVCVHYKPGDIAIVWLTGDKGKGQLISAYYIISRIENKTQIQDAVIEEVKENEGHSFRLLDGSNRSEFIKTFEKRKQNSLQLVSAATGQEVPDALISQKTIIGQQVRLVWRRMNRLVYGENLHFLTAPFHLDGYNHNAYRLYKEIRPEHRDYVVQMILAPPTMPYGSFPPPPPLTNTPAPDSQTIHTPKMNDIPSSSSSSSLSPSPLSSLPPSLSPSLHPSLSHPDPVELTDLAGTLQQDPTATDLHASLSHSLDSSPSLSSSLSSSLDVLSRPPIISGDIRVITPLTSMHDVMALLPNTNSQNSNLNSNSQNSQNLQNSKRKRQSSKEKVIMLSNELAMVRERLLKLENENYYLKYNLLQIASLGNQNHGLPYIPPLSSSPLSSPLSSSIPISSSPPPSSPSHPSSLSPSLSPSSPSSSHLLSSHLSTDLNDDEEDEDEDEEDDELDSGKRQKKEDDGLDLLNTHV